LSLRFRFGTKPCFLGEAIFEVCDSTLVSDLAIMRPALEVNQIIESDFELNTSLLKFELTLGGSCVQLDETLGR
jgi:hypothetical protein